MITYVPRVIQKLVLNYVTIDRPNDQTRSHLKPLVIQFEVDDIRINNVLIEGGAEVKLVLKCCYCEVKNGTWNT